MVEECSDPKCPVHGALRVRGTVRQAKVVRSKERNSATVEIPRIQKVRKYGRFEKRRSRLHVHVPKCMKVEEGELVEIGECRKLSKTKSHVIVKKV
ncbi:TPA: 30S ribosomal protein S17 [Candidatus Micrarchaeota archaeon]|nr:30S ribosomal protein S17 [Candidatus Micrarchaeota archaeon]